ncbi:MFS transporter [Christensenellaceae bacterium OttesenSCG-928-K19]|nr:MFS transporter [Christensenellaceae bacterium OttesenSCG-928-K19]
MKLDYKKTFLIGFGFLATSIAWAVYNNYVPIILEGYLSSTLFIGVIMTIDNIFGVVFQPIFGSISDRSKSPRGRRMPFVMLGIPICAVLLVLIPFTPTLLTTMVVVIIFNFVMSTWRAPVVALMPDLTPSPLRSKANGVINLMGGLGTLIIFVLGGMLYNAGGMSLPFIFTAIIMIAALIILRLTVKEPPLEQRSAVEKEDKMSFRQLPKEQRSAIMKSLMAILLAILFWFIAYSAVETFFSLFATNTLVNANGEALSAGDSSIMLGAFSLMYMVFAIPAGILGTKFGRKRTIMAALIGVIILFVIMYFTTSVPMFWVLLILAGICWSTVATNSYPMVVDMGTEKTTGLYTGFYYIASFSASVISPILFGAIRDTVNSYQVLFLYSAVAFAIAFVLMLFVKRGEAKPVAQGEK